MAACMALLKQGSRHCCRSCVRGVSHFSPPSRVVVVRKTTTLEYERRRNHLTEQALRSEVWGGNGIGYGVGMERVWSGMGLTVYLHPHSMFTAALQVWFR